MNCPLICSIIKILCSANFSLKFVSWWWGWCILLVWVQDQKTCTSLDHGTSILSCHLGLLVDLHSILWYVSKLYLHMPLYIAFPFGILQVINLQYWISLSAFMEYSIVWTTQSSCKNRCMQIHVLFTCSECDDYI